MARKAKGTQRGEPEREETLIMVCRGGDCGSRLKHPNFDHLAQLRKIRMSLKGQANVVASRCLDACDHSNVCVVIPTSKAVKSESEPVWIGEFNDDEATNEVLSWIIDSSASSEARPALVDINEFRPAKRNRHELDEEISKFI